MMLHDTLHGIVQYSALLSARYVQVEAMCMYGADGKYETRVTVIIAINDHWMTSNDEFRILNLNFALELAAIIGNNWLINATRDREGLVISATLTHFPVTSTEWRGHRWSQNCDGAE